MKIIDTNCSFGHWPLQQFIHQNLHQLDEALESNQISESWLTATESILFADPDVYDFALFRKLRDFPRFRPVKTVNPLLANWRESCLKSIEEYAVTALKVYPNYHNYPSNHTQLHSLADFAAEHNLPMLVSIRISDERSQPASLRIPPVNIPALTTWTGKSPDTRFILHGLYMGELARLKGHSNLYADISFLDRMDVLVNVTEQLHFPTQQLVFGSHACFFYPESSALKLKLTQSPQEIVNQIASGNVNQMKAENRTVQAASR